MYEQSDINRSVLDSGREVEEQLQPWFQEIGRTAEYNQMKMSKAMRDNQVSDVHFAAATGYGYNGLGRGILGGVYAGAFHGENVPVRPQLISETHVLRVALSDNSRPRDELLSPAGKPYDTLEEVIGIHNFVGSLKEYGMVYHRVDLPPGGTLDYDNIAKAINRKTGLVTTRHFKGYNTRSAFSVTQVGKSIVFMKKIKPEVICTVDNCYGEFMETIESTDAGVNIIVGSLVKNPGGGLAPIGGYVVGRKDCVGRTPYHFSIPGPGEEVGASLGLSQSLFQGLFLPPTVVAGALKDVIFAADIYEKLGFAVAPGNAEFRHDTIQTVTFGIPKGVIAFYQGIQAAAPVNSYVSPEPWDMPGYDAPAITAAGVFVQGSFIEFSADGPIRPPYAVYFQGGLTWYHVKLGILVSSQKLMDADTILL